MVSAGDSSKISGPWVVTTLRIPYADTDLMGHVYYGNYLTYFEVARNEYMRALGLTYREFEAMGYAVPVAEAHVEYKGRVFYDDLIEIHAHASVVGHTRIRFDYRIFRTGEDRVLSTGYSIHAVLSMETLKVVRVPDVLIEMTSKLPPLAE